ncbi:Zinc finger protein [Madurella fahalii]|uniref:Zinc finger protein n=1 Tax=Madurella fahalii TaxID=1157608 RepID=A0ABQ0GMV0_9PEZI
MSSPAQGGPSVPKEKEKEKEKKGIGKVLSRMKTVLKKADPSRRLSTLGSKPGAAATPAIGTSEPAQPAATKVPETAAVEATKVPRSQIFAERAKKLGELYGLELKPSEWHSTEGNALRVEKPIRMRVHKKCHHCGTSFGLGKECPKCKHPRCPQCPRVPPKRTEAEKEESRKRRAAILKERAEKAPIIPDWDPTPRKIVLKRPAKTGGQDLIHRKPRQRIRRTCCQCQRLFPGKTKTCEGCEHARCTDCPRDPAKKDKYPYGYPGDAPSTRIGHYTCSECKHVFSSPPSDEAACPSCSHPKCQRLTPRKVDPEPDPEVVKSLQAKIEEMKLK